MFSFGKAKSKISVRGPKPQKEISLHPKLHATDVTVQGYDNTVVVKSPRFHGVIQVYGVGNTVEIEDDVLVYRYCNIQIGDPQHPAFNCRCRIGKATAISCVQMYLLEDNSVIDVGEDCMIAYECDIWCTDTHVMYDDKGRARIGREIRIGNHVWVGMQVKIGKNSVIADGSMVGWGSVVSGRFEEPNSLIAGAPARLLKTGISWGRERPCEFQEGRKEREEQYADWRLGPAPGPLQRLMLRLHVAYYRWRHDHAKQERRRGKYAIKLAHAEQELTRGQAHYGADSAKYDVFK